LVNKGYGCRVYRLSDSMKWPMAMFACLRLSKCHAEAMSN